MFGKRILTVENETQGLVPVETKYLTEEVISALQKEVRRGSPLVFYWAHVLYVNGFWNAAFNRFKIMTMEDCSACLHLPVVIEAYYQEGKKALGKAKLTESKTVEACKWSLFKAAHALMSTPKSRCLNHILTVVRKVLIDEKENPCPSPSQALEHFESIVGEDFQASLLAAMRVIVWNSKPHLKMMWQVLEKKSVPANRPTIQVLAKWADQNLSLSVAQALACICPALPEAPFNREKCLVDHSELKNSVALICSKPLAIPDYALDKHTTQGKKLKRGLKHFYEVGALVNNEAFKDPWVEVAREWYLKVEASTSTRQAKSSAIMKSVLKRWENAQGAKPEAKSEAEPKSKSVLKKRKVRDILEEKDDTSVNTSVAPPAAKRAKKATKSTKPKYLCPIELPARPAVVLDGIPVEETKVDPFSLLADAVFTQKPCGWKPPAKLGVWNGEGDWNSRRVFLKGPESKERVLLQVWCNKIKSKLNYLRAIETRALMYQDKYYVLMPDLSEGTFTGPSTWKGQVITVVKSTPTSSKMFSEYLQDTPWDKIPENVIRQYLAVLLWRTWFGVGDTNHRNIMIKGDIIYSVDEMVVGKEGMSFVDHVSGKFHVQLVSWLKEHKKWCDVLVEGWKLAL